MGGYTVICPNCKLVWRVFPLGIFIKDEKMWEEYKHFYPAYKTLEEYRKALKENIEQQEICPNCGTKAGSIWNNKDLSKAEKRQIISEQQTQTLKDTIELAEKQFKKGDEA